MATVQPAESQHSLSISLISKLKRKSHHWRELSHEHANDRAMALGYRTHYVAKGVEKNLDSSKSTDSIKTEDESSLQTNTEAVGNLLNNCLGSGILAVPHAIKELGLGCCLMLMAISLFMNRYMLLLVMNVCDMAGLKPASYNGVASKAFGKPGRFLVVMTFVFMGFGCMVSYVAATSDATFGLAKQLMRMDLRAGSFLNVENNKWLVMALLFPPTYIRSLKSVALFSAVAFFAAVIVVICVVGHCGDILMEKGVDWAQVKYVPDSVGTLIANLPITMTVFSIQAGGSIILSGLKDDSDSNKANVSTIAFVLAYITNLSAGVPAYLVYLATVPGDVLEVMDEPGSPLIAVAKIAVLVLVVLSYMFMMIPCRVSLLEGFLGKNEAKQEASYAEFAIITTLVNVAAIGVNKVCSDLSLILGLTGAVAVNLVAFIMPAAIYIKIRSAPVDESFTAVPISSVRNIPYFLLILYAFGSMAFGLKQLLLP